MRKVDDGEEIKEKKSNKIMTFIVATNVIASRPPESDQLERCMLVHIESNCIG